MAKISFEGNTFPGGGISKSFTIKCNKCGSDEITIDYDLHMGSSWTGQYGSIDMVCDKCQQREIIYD